MAAQTLELWGTPSAVSILKQHEEKVPWLRDYIEEVIELMDSV